jgi:hypothetical protein
MMDPAPVVGESEESSTRPGTSGSYVSGSVAAENGHNTAARTERVVTPISGDAIHRSAWQATTEAPPVEAVSRSTLRVLVEDTTEDLAWKFVILIRVLFDSLFVVGWAIIRNYVHHFLESGSSPVDQLGGWQLFAAELVFDISTLAAILLIVAWDLRVIFRRTWGK